jgi:uncharacterized protein
MDRLFLDVNVLFSAAYRPGAGLLRIWRLKNVALCSSRYALSEANINLEEEEQRRRLGKLSQRLQLFDPPSGKLPAGIALPEKDAPILLAAIEARAKHLLTGDMRDFGPYFGKRIEGVMIMLPGEYLRVRSRPT